MNKYKVGDKVVLEIISGEAYGDYLAGSKEQNWWFNAEGLERGSEPLSTYTEPLEAKIRRQAAEITRLLAENKELKEDFEKSKRVNLNMGRLAGQNEAWELARKITCQPINGGFNRSEFEKIFGYGYISDIFEKYKYTEAATKVAEWEKGKEEIEVGDVYMSRVGNYFVIYDIDHEKGIAKILWSDLSNSARELDDIKEYYIKTGRHIDIDSFLKQIGEKQK